MPDPRFPFSNFQPCLIVGKDGIRYGSVENFFVAMKTTDLAERRKIAAMKPGEAKRAGRALALRPGWEDMKTRVMLYALRQKFAPGSLYARELLAYRGEVVEWNRWHDRTWGRCTCAKCGGSGKNLLGVMLGHVRGELRAL